MVAPFDSGEVWSCSGVLSRGLLEEVGRMEVVDVELVGGSVVEEAVEVFVEVSVPLLALVVCEEEEEEDCVVDDKMKDVDVGEGEDAVFCSRDMVTEAGPGSDSVGSKCVGFIVTSKCPIMNSSPRLRIVSVCCPCAYMPDE